MRKRLATILAAVLAILGAVALSIIVWGASDPEGCSEGDDPAVALANKRAGGSEPYSDWCYSHEGNRLHVVEAGEGDVVLFIHGFPSIWYSMIRPMDALRGEFRVVAIDGLGAGRSDAPADVDDYKLSRMSQHLDALVESLGVNQVHLVGHDWGAAFAGAYAQSRPDKVRTVTIMSAPPQNVAVQMLETSERQRAISQYVERLKSATPPLAWLSGAGDRIAQGPQNHFEAGRMSKAEAEVLQSATSDLRRINRHINWYRANLPAPDDVGEDDFWPSRGATFQIPALLIWGEDDTIFDPAFIDMMTQNESKLTVLRIDGVGHAPQFEATDQVNEALLRHLKAWKPD